MLVTASVGLLVSLFASDRAYVRGPIVPRTAVAAVVPITDLSHLPLIITLAEIAKIYRLSPSTIRRGLQNGTFSPRPWDRYPYRWKRDDVAADLNRRRAEHQPRPHGFASTKRRQAKATITSPRSKRHAG